MDAERPVQLSSSQPIGSVPASQLSTNSQLPRRKKAYRPARPLPYELRDHCNVYIEEELYSQALSLLLNTLIAGSDGTVDGRLLSVCVPPTQILALAATLIIHPTMTNRASSPDKVQVANEALSLLQHVNTLVGPISANFSTAFHFSFAGVGRRDRRRSNVRTADSTMSGDEDEKFEIDLATKGAVWNRAEDFWQVLGWAFNCSVSYPKRWDRWKLWLKFMLDVLEDDLEEKITASKVPEAGGDEKAKESVLAESLLAQYLVVTANGRGNKRRVMRAILADGSKKSLDEFGEIWKHETKPPKQDKEATTSERKKIDFEEGEYADYMDLDDDEDDGDTTNTDQRQSRRKRGRPRPTPSAPDGEATDEYNTPSDWGGSESMALRKRVIALLMKICVVYEDAFMEIEDYVDLLTEFIRPLPLSIFGQFVLPISPYLEPHGQASLNQNLLRPIISSDAPVYKAEIMTQAEFEKHFLAYPANYTNHVENARVSILVEGLLRLMFRHIALKVTSSLTSGLEEGIKAREHKAKFGGRKKVGTREAEEERAVKMLELSALRMRTLLKVAGAAE